MPVSEVSIINVALQKLGAALIGSRDDDTTEGRAMDACFDHVRDLELCKHLWKFATKRDTLAPSATEPEFDYDYAFPLPSDCLRLLPPARHDVDWIIESIDDSPAILTNETNTLEIRFIYRVTDPTKWDPAFAEMLACALAMQTCETITQSNTKKEEIKQAYKDAKNEAKKKNAFESNVPEEPDSPWIVARL